MQSSVVFCPSPPLPHPTLRPLLLLTLFSTLFDELIHLRILQLYIPHLHPSAACLIGTPAPPTSVDGDCCICFGTLIVPPSSSILSSSSYDDPTDRIDAETLDTFCHIPHHVAHRACMRRWVAAGRPWAAGGAGIVLGPGGMTILGGGRGEPTCPSCRGEIVGHMVVVEAKLRQEGGKGTEWRRWWAEVRRQIVWRDVGVRWVVTVAYVVVFWARGKWRDEGAWGWKGNARRTESWVVIGDVMR
ncbi:hypothetical protein BC938DRAFT_476613 [Jimgerdemannia flammicorona]|uniref:Uncharacterized protein n=1 Tax=Jimgerdemannia flammicorona TaxID=994334 RepID=A0A433QQ99_9FUNG|nr:hypothetical protein BC938DRAFT_476613 [Jimgerdemannia flammicorona]